MTAIFENYKGNKISLNNPIVYFVFQVINPEIELKQICLRCVQLTLIKFTEIKGLSVDSM